jgi:hypothetical protein
MLSPPKFDETPLPPEVAGSIRSAFEQGLAQSYPPRALVKAGLVTYHPLRGGIYWRRQGIKYIIIHSTEPVIPQPAVRIIESWSSMGRRHPGAQYVIDRDGAVFQALDPDLASVHVNIFKTLPGINNDNSVGIEMCHAGSQDYPASQTDSLIKLVVYLQDHYHVDDENVVTHRYAQQGDHTDPVNFAWDKFIGDKQAMERHALALRFSMLARESENWETAIVPQPEIYLQLHRPIGLPVTSAAAPVNQATGETAGNSTGNSTGIPTGYVRLETNIRTILPPDVSPTAAPRVTLSLPLRGPIELEPAAVKIMQSNTGSSAASPSPQPANGLQSSIQPAKVQPATTSQTPAASQRVISQPTNIQPAKVQPATTSQTAAANQRVISQPANIQPAKVQPATTSGQAAASQRVISQPASIQPAKVQPATTSQTAAASQRVISQPTNIQPAKVQPATTSQTAAASQRVISQPTNIQPAKVQPATTSGQAAAEAMQRVFSQPASVQPAKVQPATTSGQAAAEAMQRVFSQPASVQPANRQPAATTSQTAAAASQRAISQPANIQPAKVQPATTSQTAPASQRVINQPASSIQTVSTPRAISQPQPAIIQPQPARGQSAPAQSASTQRAISRPATIQPILTQPIIGQPANIDAVQGAPVPTGGPVAAPR